MNQNSLILHMNCHMAVKVGRKKVFVKFVGVDKSMLDGFDNPVKNSEISPWAIEMMPPVGLATIELDKAFDTLNAMQATLVGVSQLLKRDACNDR